MKFGLFLLNVYIINIIGTVTSFLPTLLARVLKLQSNLRADGQIPVSLTPSLELEIGLNPPDTTSIIDYDWKAWAKQERLKIYLFPIWRDFESASRFLPMTMKFQLAALLGSFQLHFQGTWPAQTPEALLMLQMVWSPVSGNFLVSNVV